MSPHVATLAAVATAIASAGCSTAPSAPEDRPRARARSEAERCAATPRAEDAAAREVASLAREPILRAFRRDQPRHTCCYEAHLTRHPSAGGRAILSIEFDGAEVAEASIARSDPELALDEAFSACLLATAMSMRVPEWERAPDEEVAEPDARASPGETMPEAPAGPSWPPSKVRISYPLSFSTPMASN